MAGPYFHHYQLLTCLSGLCAPPSPCPFSRIVAIAQWGLEVPEEYTKGNPFKMETKEVPGLRCGL